MAEGILRHVAGERFEVHSAGISPSQLRPEAVAVMREIGIDISNHQSKSVEEFIDQQFDYIITVCDNANETCPAFPGTAERIHWSFDDPAAAQGSDEQRLEVFRSSRNQIRDRLEQWSSKSIN